MKSIYRKDRELKFVLEKQQKIWYGLKCMSAYPFRETGLGGITLFVALFVVFKGMELALEKRMSFLLEGASMFEVTCGLA